jgi:hypothetical protein
MEVGGLFGLIILALDVYAVLKIVQSSAETLAKVIWIVVVLVLPLLGLIVWYLFGPGGSKG